MRVGAFSCVLLAAGCQPVVMPAASPPATPAPASTAADIRGDWRLVRLAGRAADEQPPGAEIPATIRLVVGDVTFRANSQCVGFAWRYERTGEKVALRPDNPGPMCARGLTTWEKDFDRILSAVTDASIVDGMLRLSGAGGDMEFAPGAPPVAVDLKGNWELIRLDADLARADHGLPQGIPVAITGETIRAQSQCVIFAWSYRQSGEQVETRPEDAGPVCERTRTEWEQRFARIMDSVNIAHPVNTENLVLAGSAGQAEFRRRP